MSTHSDPRTVQALMVALGALKKQNDQLIETNAALLAQHDEMNVYCRTINTIVDIMLKLKREMEESKATIKHVSDSQIMLWAQLAAHGIGPGERPISPAAPVNGVSADISLSDLYCSDTD